jgi:hypothetical protein
MKLKGLSIPHNRKHSLEETLSALWKSATEAPDKEDTYNCGKDDVNCKHISCPSCLCSLSNSEILNMIKKRNIKKL